MSNFKMIQLDKPAEDPFHEVLRPAVRKRLAKAVEVNFNALLSEYVTLDANGKKTLCATDIYLSEGYKPDWIMPIQTSKADAVQDEESSWVGQYAASTAFESLLGTYAKRPSATRVNRIEQRWEEHYYVLQY